MNRTPIATIDAAEASRRLAAEAPEGERPLLVDVREPNEYAALRVPGALLVPLSEFPARYAELPRDRPLLVMCAAGKRSLVAAQYLRGAGYHEVANIDGGIIAWQRAGYPTEEGTVGGAEDRSTGG